MENALEHKLHSAGFHAVAINLIGSTLALAYPQCLIVTKILGLELEAMMTLNVLISTQHVFVCTTENPAGTRKQVSHLQHAKTWQLIFTDSTHQDVTVKSL